MTATATVTAGVQCYRISCLTNTFKGAIFILDLILSQNKGKLSIEREKSELDAFFLYSEFSPCLSVYNQITSSY